MWRLVSCGEADALLADAKPNPAFPHLVDNQGLFGARCARYLLCYDDLALAASYDSHDTRSLEAWRVLDGGLGLRRFGGILG